ncbi:MAG TPA: CoA pyrophosphatase [Usitatibacter sp.]
MMEAQPYQISRVMQISERVLAHEPLIAERDGTYFEAAVALVIRGSRQGGIELLFIKRAARADDPWSGQIAFPGGRRDPVDQTLEDTAVRETLEEVGLDLRKDSTILGALDEVRPRISVLPPVIVRPFVALSKGDPVAGVSDEVAGSFWAPLHAILDPAATRVTAIDVRGARTMRPAIHFEGHVIWGMTENILRKFAEVIG